VLRPASADPPCHSSAQHSLPCPGAEGRAHALPAQVRRAQAVADCAAFCSCPVMYAPRTEGARSASGAGRQFHARGAGQVHLPGQIIAGYASRQLKAEALVIRIDPRVAKPNPRGCGGSAPRNARQAHSRPHVCQRSTKVRSNNQPSPTEPRTRRWDRAACLGCP
jgi:hypothetical protein